MNNVRLQFMDILGVPKEVLVPFSRREQVLRQGVLLDGSALEGFVRSAEADMLLQPDPATEAQVPDLGLACSGDVRFLGDVRLPDGRTYEGCPRTLLRRVEEEVRSAGLTLRVGAEVEFFLLSDPHVPAAEVTLPADAAGYFDAAHGAAGEQLRADLTHALGTMGVAVVGSHHEVAPAQHEIDLEPTGAVALADAITTVRWLVRMTALARGLRATFMPKPFGGLSGSGLHLALEVAAPQAREEGEGAGLSFAAGILAHAPALCALANPTVNSYKRLVPGYEAPVYITWARRERSPLLRVLPGAEGEGKGLRLEYRGPDAAANPYLLLAGVMWAGLDGLRRHLALPAATEENPGHLSREERRRRGIRHLPRDLREALDAFAQDAVVQEGLGEVIARRILEAREIEWEIYREVVHPWEREQYLDSL
jgi:glutamine synthetase